MICMTSLTFGHTVGTVSVVFISQEVGQNRLVSLVNLRRRIFRFRAHLSSLYFHQSFTLASSVLCVRYIDLPAVSRYLFVMALRSPAATHACYVYVATPGGRGGYSGK